MKMPMLQNLFIMPPNITTNSNYIRAQGRTLSYAEYNYLRPGILSWVKRQHFEAALRLTKSYFDHCNAIDFGCADGVFLPSLSKYCNQVLGIDNNPEFINQAEQRVNMLQSSNVRLICNQELDAQALRKLINKNGADFKVLYLLEALEHIGVGGSLFYESKIAFLSELFNLISNDGVIVISVPVMVGLPFLVQRLALMIFNLYKDSISIKDCLKAIFLHDADNLEKNWESTKHVGFNHLKLEKFIMQKFKIIKKKNLFFQMVYVLKNNA